MKTARILTVIALTIAPETKVTAQTKSPELAGETYELTKSYETSERSSDGSSGSSRGSDTILERVIAVRDVGLELEYDLNSDAKAEERSRSWQFPARIFKPRTGPTHLLNVVELEARLAGWLKVGGWDRSICGRWIFTWNAFRIDCDPQAIVKTIETFSLRSQDLRDGSVYRDADAGTSRVLTKTSDCSNGDIFGVVLEVDPVTIQRARAEMDVAAGEIMQKRVTLETALRERKREQVSGTISVVFETDAAGNPQKRTKTTKLEIKRPDGVVESRSGTETVERRRVPAPVALW